MLGEEYEQAITNLMEMGGYDRDEVVRAMNASFNNPSRAAEYLMSVSVHYILSIYSSKPFFKLVFRKWLTNFLSSMYPVGITTFIN